MTNQTKLFMSVLKFGKIIIILLNINWGKEKDDMKHKLTFLGC